MNVFQPYLQWKTGDQLMHTDMNRVEAGVQEALDNAEGTVGPQGPQGIPGPEGPQGPAGSSGSDGMKGEQGPIGPEGPEGPVGPAGLTWRGQYNPSTEYVLDDAVSYMGATYFCLETVIGTAPLPENDSWALLAAQGARGPAGIDGAIGPQGIRGIQGIPGPQGLNGAKGDTGPQGPAYVPQYTNTPLTGVTIAGYSYESLSVLRCGRICQLDISLNVTATVNGQLRTIVVLPELSRPTVKVRQALVTSTGKRFVITLDTNGDVGIFNPTGFVSGDICYISISYINNSES